MASTSVALPTRPRGALLRWRRLPVWIRYAILLGGLIALWWAWIVVRDVQPYFAATPLNTLEAFVDGWRDGTLRGVTWATLKVLVVGIGIGALVAAVLATLATLTQIGDDLLRLLTAILNPLPGVAVLPLAMLWFGLNTKAVLFVIANSAAWPIAINLTTGFRTVNQTIVSVGRNIGLSRWRLVTDVLAPAALPHAISGIRTGWAFGWRTIIAAELVFGVAGAESGLGNYIDEARQYLDAPPIFAALVTIALLGIVFEWMFVLLERRTVVRWGMKTS